MNIKILKAAVAGLVLLVSSFSNAGLLYDAGTPASGSGFCDAEGCSGSTEWWVLDDFTSSSDWLITGFEFFSVSGSNLNYISTSWEIISSDDPFGAALYSGSNVANVSGNSYLLSGLNIALSAGDYFLAHHHDYSVEYATAAMVTGNSGSFFHTDKASFEVTRTGELAQKIYGNVAVVPEPTTLAIFALGVIGLASRRVKKES